MSKKSTEELKARVDKVKEALSKNSPTDALGAVMEIMEIAAEVSKGPDECEDYSLYLNVLLDMAMVGHITVANTVGGSTEVRDSVERLRQARREAKPEDKPKPDNNGGLRFL